MKLLILTISILSQLVLKYSDVSEPAVTFLNSLNAEQKTKAHFAFEDASREQWHFLPATSFPRVGIMLKDLNDEQKKLAFDLLKSHLSESGYDKARRIIALEDVLAELGEDPDYRDPEKYHISIYGDPGKDDTWGWSFEGHHISLNFTIIKDKIIMAPRFFGSNPAIVPSGTKKGERVLEREEEMGFELVNSLNEDQKEQAIIRGKAYGDIISTNKTAIDPLEKVGIAMKDLNSDQQALLLSLIDEYLSAMPKKLAALRMSRLKNEDPYEILFAWAGATSLGKGHYYRIQGSTFLIEFDNVQTNANHIHTVWRDFEGDFGRDLLKEHYQNSPHHKN